MWEGDITTLEVDAIVNSTSRYLRHNGDPHTVCYAIQRAAGPVLGIECSRLNVNFGDVAVTKGYDLPAQCECHMNL